MLLRALKIRRPNLAPTTNGSVAVFVAVLTLSAAGAAADACQRDCANDPACEIAVTDCLIEAGRTREAVDRLKPLVWQHPDVPVFARLLARAYLADNNQFWAERTLQEALARNPNDCMSRSWLAWVYLRNGDFDLAREILDQAGCPGAEAERARWLLLRAFMAHAAGDAQTAALMIEQVPEVGKLFSEDEGLWLFLRRARQPGWIDPISTRLELGGGYTSNSRAGSPTDPGTSGPSSALGRMDLFGRLVWPASPALRPTLEGNIKGHGITADETSDLSYLGLSVRPGILIGGDFPRVLVGYKADLLLLNEPDKREFHEGHRGEIEVEDTNTTFFIGGGHRRFAESGRTRWELDGGFGGAVPFPHRVSTLFALSLRYYNAVGEAYDLVGGTGLAVARVSIGAGAYARLATTVGLDYYFSSGGSRGQVAYGIDDKRFDIPTTTSAELWSPPWRGLRAGLSYEFSWRGSNADTETQDYEYTEHRFLLKTRWTFDMNPWAPAVVTPENHLALDYGLAGGPEASLDNERIQDLLRQDEAARHGSSCAD
jgi:hypothetical protein